MGEIGGDWIASGWGLRRGSPTRTAGAEAARADGLPSGIDAATREQLLGAWEPLIAPSPPWPPRWRWQNIEYTDDGRWRAFPLVNMGSGRWRHEPDGTLLAFSGSGMTQRMVTGWVDLYPWLFPVARAGFDQRDQLVLLDDTNHELQRLQRMASDSSGAASSDQQ